MHEKQEFIDAAHKLAAWIVNNAPEKDRRFSLVALKIAARLALGGEEELPAWLCG